MQYGVSSAIEGDVVDFIIKAVDTFNVIELVSEYPHVHYSKPNIEALIGLKERYDLTYTLHAPFCSVNLASINPHIREASVDEVLNSIAYASTLGCELVVVHPGIVSFPRSLKQFERISRENEFDSFRRICEKAEEERLLTCLENMPRSPPAFKESWTGDEMVEIVDEFGSKFLQLTLDIGHCNTTDIPIVQMIHKFGARIKHVHVHDNDGLRETHSVVGSGSVMWRNVIRELSVIGYDGFLIDEHRTIEGQRQGKMYLEPIIKSFTNWRRSTQT